MDGRPVTSSACPTDGTVFVDTAAGEREGAAVAFFTRGHAIQARPAAAPAGPVSLGARPAAGASTAKIGSSLFTPTSLPPAATAAATAIAHDPVHDPLPAGVDATMQQPSAERMQPVPMAAVPDAAADPRPASEAEAGEYDGDPENDPAVRAEAHQLIGQVLGDRYRVEEMIGVGGMGIVYRATHVTIGKPMAVKVLRVRHARQESVSARFAQEAQLASKIKHPNVVDIVDYGQAPSGAPYYVMEHLQGHSLAWEVDNRGRLAPLRAFDIAIQIAAGLGEAHKHGVVHRDLKPDNVFLCPSSDEGRDLVKLLDFGIARQAGRKTRFTAAGAVVGTPEYMSPEQAQGKEVDPRADLYSLGVILFEMMAGEVPFRADTMVGTLTKQVFEAPPPLRQFEPSLPQLPNLERLLARLLAKNVDERPSTAAEVIAALKSARQGDLTENGNVAKPQQRATVALGSWGVGDQAPGHVAGAMESPATARGPMMSPPTNAGWAGAEAPPKRPSVIVRDGTPSEFVPAPGRSRGAHGRSVLPIVLLGLGAAVFAALLTVALVRYVDRQAAAADASATATPAPTVETAPGPEAAAEPDPAAPAAPAGDEPESGEAAGELADDGSDEVVPASVAPQVTKKPSKRKSKKKVAKASKPRNDDPPPVQRPGSSKGDTNGKKPRDPPPPPSVSLGDLKDPFGEK